MIEWRKVCQVSIIYWCMFCSRLYLLPSSSNISPTSNVTSGAPARKRHSHQPQRDTRCVAKSLFVLPPPQSHLREAPPARPARTSRDRIESPATPISTKPPTPRHQTQQRNHGRLLPDRRPEGRLAHGTLFRSLQPTGPRTKPPLIPPDPSTPPASHLPPQKYQSREREKRIEIDGDTDSKIALHRRPQHPLRRHLGHVRRQQEVRWP